MRIGALRHRVALQSKTATPNASAGFDESYATVATVWGRVETLARVAYLDGQQLEDRVTHRITIRYRSDALTAWRYALFDGNRYYVRGVRELDDRKRFIELQAERLEA